MNVDARLTLNMSQRLVMTPMLQQAIKLLQMSRLELVDLVKQEMLENPVLDELDDTEEQSTERQMEADSAYPDENMQDDQSSESGVATLETEGQNTHQDSSVNWEEYFNDNPGGLGYHGEYDPDEGTPSFDNLLSKPPSLLEHLSWQLQMSQVSERKRKIGEFLIGQIGEDGYLHCEYEEAFPLLNIYASNSKPKQLEAYRAFVIKTLCKKMNIEFERAYLLSEIDLPAIQGVLANVLLHEYHEDLNNKNYAASVAKLNHFTFEDFEIIAKFISEIPIEKIERLTHISAPEIAQGITAITNICRILSSTIEQHSRVLLKENYLKKLEKLAILPEELYLLEYLLSQLSAEEVAYLAYKENVQKAEKHEKEIQEFLEQLRQSYAHIENLQSHKYFLIQLYMVGIGLIGERFNTNSPIRFQKFFLKLLHVTEDDVISIVNNPFSSLRTQYYEQETRVSPEEVEQALRHIQTFTPQGIGARDLQECIMMQARSLGLLNTVLEPLIENSLYELQHHRYGEIVTKLGISLEEVELAQKIISNMSPKPGADFVNESPEYVVPDIYVYKVDNEYEVVLNEDDLPNLRVNPTYKKIIAGDGYNVPSSTKQYVDQKLRSAVWFIRSIEQRKRTVYKVGKSIVKFQKDFLEYGVSHLKPLVLRDVADDIAMHESTVSRVTTNKYIYTPQGMFELKFFFHSGLESSSGDDVSSIAIKEKIKQMIEEEDCERPLSDKAIEQNMKKAGVAIARRTIAKYREDLNIPSSIQRKRKKIRNG